MNFLIINAGCRHFGRGGTLSKTMTDTAVSVLEGLGHRTVVTEIENGWTIEEEVRKILAADVLVIQTPGWWMSTPWQLKKYEDEVFVQPGIASGDGRSRNDPTKRYGTGGQLHDKRYLISSTWNAPLEAFTDPDQFFEGRGIDGLFMPLHKTFEFIGMRRLPSFMVNDVFKHPTIPEDLERWKAHLTKLFG